MKIFPAFAARKIGVWYFQAEDESAYARGEACRGFGSVKYWDGAVYVGGLYFNGREYKQLGFGIQVFSESPLGQPVLFRSCRLSFFAGEYDYSKSESGWIYGNGILYYTDSKTNRPAYFTKGFFDGLKKVKEWEGAFGADRLADGYSPRMEREFDDREDLFCWELSNAAKATALENLFIGDSYFEFWQRTEYAGKKTFCKVFPRKRNLNLGLGGTTFSEWCLYTERIKGIVSPQRIFINLGFNDLHSGKPVEGVCADCRMLIKRLKTIYPNSKYYLLNITKAPCFPYCRAIEEEFNARMLLIAEEENVSVIDVRSEMEKQGGSVFYKDKVHLNAAGYLVLGKLLRRYLKQ